MPQIDRQKSTVAEIGSESPQQKQAEVETYFCPMEVPFQLYSYAYVP